MRQGYGAASKRSIGPTPERPARQASQKLSTSQPRGVIAPIPVTATRRRAPPSGICGLLSEQVDDEVDDVVHGAEVLQVDVLGRPQVEFALQRHRQLHAVQRVQAERCGLRLIAVIEKRLMLSHLMWRHLALSV